MMEKNASKNRVGLLGRILNILGNAVLIILIAIGVLVAFSLIPIKGNYRIMSVMSGSMEPALPVGSLIVVKPSSNYRVGDIITFLPIDAKTKEENVTHRLYSIEETGSRRIITTKGDANKDPDERTITQDRVIGKHLFTVALLGYVLTYIKTLPGLILIILVPSIIIVYEEVNKIRREAKRMIDQRKKKHKGKRKK